mgnify:CR=1 FL=1|tara:strand:+ start:1147 stop:1551 length:405 start_codon:yes stop_codon:yes gene_type:complete
MASKSKYSDVDIDFNKNDFTSDVSVKKDRSAVQQSVINIIMTRKGEKRFDPNFGVGIHDLLFENLSPIEIAMMEKTIAAQFSTYEPRALLENVVFNEEYIDSNELSIDINYVILTSSYEDVSKETFTVSLTKVR